MCVDLLIENGTIYTEGGWVQGDLLIAGERIAGITRSQVVKAARTIDAAGKHVIPGVVDAHVHLRDPGYTHKEDYATGTMAAAAGGVTTVMDQPNTDPVPNTAERYLHHIGNAASKAYVDFNSMASPSVPDQIEAISEIGAACFKIFQKKTVYPYDTEASIPESDRILEAFRMVARTGKPCSVHPHNNHIHDSLIRQARSEGRLDARRFGEITTNGTVYSSAVPELLYYQERTGVYYYALHCMFSDYIEMVRRAKSRGAGVIADCIYFALVPPQMDEFDILRNHLTVGLTREDREACWEAVLDGTIDFIDTDHAPHTRDEITMGLENPEKMALGIPGVEHFLSLLLTEVGKGRLPLGRLVELVSVNPAKKFGLYPRKGSLQVGTDADVVILDLNRESTITGDRLYTRCGWTAYEGQQVRGMPTHTILRGKVIAEEGRVIGTQGYGRFVPVM
ncbi:MAG: dihydroorotase family protein [Actinobacteria bacterium]|nr:dihydroorotase family protein [Actinomycetota bacterium]